MQLRIRHETLYRYSEPVKHSIQSLRLTPRCEAGQRAVSWQIAAPGRRKAQMDAHGNVTHLLTMDEPHSEIHILVDGIVETDDVGHESLPDDGLLSPLVYLGETALTRSDEPLKHFARKFFPSGGKRADALMRLAYAISDLVIYEQGATDVSDSAARVFAYRKGVCQDHAHVFIACCRSVGIPARYVSGYLYTESGSRPELSGHIASHAWADAWLGAEYGWMSIDVTNRTLADGRHCRLALGRDYLDACPVRGVRRGGGFENLRVAVSVAAAAQQQ